jgi:hypothetical protein
VEDFLLLVVGTPGPVSSTETRRTRLRFHADGNLNAGAAELDGVADEVRKDF